MTTGQVDTDSSGVSVGELSRMVRDVLVRFEGLAARLETGFVRADIFGYYKQQVENDLSRLSADNANAADRAGVQEKFKELEANLDRKASKSELEALSKRVAELEDDKKWLTRIVGTFIILGVLGAVFVVAKAGGGG